MLRVYYRPADDQDLGEMKRGSGSLARNVTVIALPLCLVVFGAIYLLSHSSVLAGSIASLLFLASLTSNFRFFSDIKRRELAKTNPQAVEVLEVEAVRVLECEHLGSHGPAFCFFVGNGKALLLVGQWLLRNRSFPSLNFRLHRWSDTGKPIRIELTGSKIKAEPSTASLRPGYRNKDIEVFDASPDALQADLDRAFGN